jgi:hypothetical protein
LTEIRRLYCEIFLTLVSDLAPWLQLRWRSGPVSVHSGRGVLCAGDFLPKQDEAAKRLDKQARLTGCQ